MILIYIQVQLMVDDLALSKLWILSGIDKLMYQNKDNRKLFIILFQKKQTALRLIQQSKLDAKRYKSFIVKACQHQNRIINNCAKNDAYKIKDVKSKLFLDEWFKEIIENTKQYQKEQHEIYKKHLEAINESRFSLTLVDEVQKSLIKLEHLQVLQSKMPNTQQLDYKQLISFKAMERYLQKYENNYSIYSQVFDRKAKMLSLVEKKEINAQKYRKYLEAYIREKIKNESILYLTKLELQSLSIFHNNNVETWFLQIINTAKLSLDEELQKLVTLKYKSKVQNSLSSQPLKKSVVSPKTNNSEVIIDVSEDTSHIQINRIDTLNNLMLIDDLLRKNKQNPMNYVSLFERKKKVLSELKDGKLTAEKYHNLQEDMLAKTHIREEKKVIELDLSRLKVCHHENKNEWFQELKRQTGQSLLQQRRIYYRLLAQVKQKQKGEVKSEKKGSNGKVEQFLSAMGKYESLLMYFKSNKISYKHNKFLIEYQQQIRKRTHYYIEKIQNDVYPDFQDFISSAFPPIDQTIFYADKLKAYRAKIQQLKDQLQMEINDLNEYKGKLQNKRYPNINNILQADKQISNCEFYLKYLSDWPHGEYQAFPEVTYQKVKKLQVDVNQLNPDQIQFEMDKIEGLPSQHILNIYFFDFEYTQHSFIVQNGANKHVSFIHKLSPNQVHILRNKTSNFIGFKLLKKGFFGGLTLVAETNSSAKFQTTNSIELTVQLQNILLECTVKVEKPNSSCQRQINHLNITQYFPFKHDPYIEAELIKKYMPYSKPSSSEIGLS